VVPPTQNSEEVSFCDVYEIRDGRVARWRTYFDAATMMGQLGVLPPPE
jgi:limonene-1,2-epoxide hydrolase